MKNITLSKFLPRFIKKRLLAAVALISTGVASQASGILTPLGSPNHPLILDEHHVRVTINNGFAYTEVEQVFANPNSHDVEAIYTTPIPELGALSELKIDMGEKTINGEVVRKAEAEAIYQAEKQAGHDTGKATQNTYQTFEFSVSKIPSNSSVRLHYAYYEPLKLDTGIGRYSYRVEEGGTDEQANAFWSSNTEVSSHFTIDLKLHSAWPIANVRTPSFNGTINQIDEKTTHYNFSQNSAFNLNQDFVFYYKLQDDLPGRLEMLTYKPIKDEPGTFMLLMTPGDDLKALENGSDYVFVIDVSGSMQSKLSTLVNGISKAIGKLRPEDRYRIVTFNNTARELHSDWRNATLENIADSTSLIQTLQANQGTNLYNGIETGLNKLDADRVSSIILITDGVANNGIVNSEEFYKLLHQKDIRFYGFLLGNSSNWPLMRLMCDASGGYYKSVSNSSDIIGEIILAKNKITYESMHEANLAISGIKAFDVSNFQIGKIHYGEQLIFFGKYDKAGIADISLKTKISGQDKTYSAKVAFPQQSKHYPELERMWALDQVQKIKIAKMSGLADPQESDDAISDIGVAYQIVTEGTSMIALDDAGFNRHGIERKNQVRLQTEQTAKAQRPHSNGAQRVDSGKPMYKKHAPSFGGGGGGSIEPWFALLVAAVGVWYWWSKKRQQSLKAPLVAATIITATAFTASNSHGESNVQNSIQNFWNVSESEAKRLPLANAVITKRNTSYTKQATEPVYIVKPDQHQVEQEDSDKESSSHFNFKIFDTISLYKMEWGDRDKVKTDKYQGTVRR